MEAANVPSFIPAPFGTDASSSYIRSIPTTQPVPGDGEASFDLGFPPETFTPPSGGGFAPDGRDFNGLLNQVTALQQWYCAGGPVQWSSTYSTTIGGYAKGAVVASATTLGVFWFSTADSNVTNPDTGGAGWVRWLPAAYYGQDTGSANAYAVAFPIPYVTRVPGTVLYVKIANANTGASTLTPGTGLGATIVQANGTALVAGALVAGMIAAFVDNGTYYQLVNPALPALPHGGETYATAGTFNFTVPVDVYWLDYIVTGGGGGGAGNGNGQSGGGGGAGGTSKGRLAVSPGMTLTVIVGAAGSGAEATGGDSSGGVGGTSSITGSEINISATGGIGGNNITDTGTTAGGSGGEGTGGQTNVYGGFGTDGFGNVGSEFPYANYMIEGMGGASFWGGGGRGGNGGGEAGQTPGSGGGGGYGAAAANGANGAPGIVELIW